MAEAHDCRQLKRGYNDSYSIAFETYEEAKNWCMENRVKAIEVRWYPFGDDDWCSVAALDTDLSTDWFDPEVDDGFAEYGCFTVEARGMK